MHLTESERSLLRYTGPSLDQDWLLGALLLTAREHGGA